MPRMRRSDRLFTKGLMAVPLLHEERALGVLEVLDRAAQASSPLAEMDLLALFADQAAIALDLLQSARRARAALGGSSGNSGSSDGWRSPWINSLASGARWGQTSSRRSNDFCRRKSRAAARPPGSVKALVRPHAAPKSPEGAPQSLVGYSEVGRRLGPPASSLGCGLGVAPAPKRKRRRRW